MPLKRAGLWIVVAAACACDGSTAATDTAKGGVGNGGVGDSGTAGTGNALPVMDFTRDIQSTDLALDVTTLSATATITVAGSLTSTSASFEIGDLALTAVRDPAGPRDYQVASGPPRRVDVAIPSSSQPASVTFEYTFQSHPRAEYDGWMAEAGASFLWPYFCGNLFPCKSAPDDGTTFTAAVTGVPSGQFAVFPAAIRSPAPSYMFALAVGNYSYHEIGVTTAGTQVGIYTLPGGDIGITTTASMRDMFDWLEQSLGPYAFGDRVASVQVFWGTADIGGMEHHPFWHLGTASVNNETTHVHEAAHGWYGDGVRMRCWEDFVLSEGTTTYLAAEAFTAVHGAAAGDQVWAGYATRLDSAIAAGDTAAYPDGCNVIDILHDPLWSPIPYYKGAYFYRAVAGSVGSSTLLGVLRRFYLDHVGQAASMQDLLDAIREQTGFDPTDLANGWLRGLGHP
jgi:hypothetical protein